MLMKSLKWILPIKQEYAFIKVVPKSKINRGHRFRFQNYNFSIAVYEFIISCSFVHCSWEIDCWLLFFFVQHIKMGSFMCANIGLKYQILITLLVSFSHGTQNIHQKRKPSQFQVFNERRKFKWFLLKEKKRSINGFDSFVELHL